VDTLGKGPGGDNGTGDRLPEGAHHRHHGHLIPEAIHGGAHTHASSASGQGHGHRDGGQTGGAEHGQGHLRCGQGPTDGMGGGQGGGRLLDETQHTSADGPGTGAPLGLDPVGTGLGQGHGQLLLLIERQHVGNGHGEHHVWQKLTGAVGEAEHVVRLKAQALGVEGIEIADLHHGGSSGHSRREEGGIHRRDAQRQSGGHGENSFHQGGITGEIKQIGTPRRCGPGDPRHRDGITICQAGNHFEQPLLADPLPQGGRQAGVTRHLRIPEVVDLILPSNAARGRAWGPDQDRLHRHLLRHPALLPKGASLLVAVSGGQDSMALIGLLQDLRALHGWQLNLWHGDHGWRAEAAAQGEELAAWADAQHLPLLRQRAVPVPASEAEARQWRYDCLQRQAEALGCRHVLTGHTASDRAETLLLNLARGSHRRGLASLRTTRPLAENCALVRPLLPFSRQDTARFCHQRGLPVWIDASNTDPRFSRNRVRAEVLPVLEDLHPGAATRIAATAERLAQDEDQEEELIDIALKALAVPADPGDGEEIGLARCALAALQPANQRRLLQAWLRRHWGGTLPASNLAQVIARIPMKRGLGEEDLAQGWRLRLDRHRLVLLPPRSLHPLYGELP